MPDLAEQEVPATERQSLPAKERDAAMFMMLDRAPSTQQANTMVAALAKRLHGVPKDGKHPKPSKGFVAAVGALVSDLFRMAKGDLSGWGYRSHRSEAFSGYRIGARPFKLAITAMRAEGLIEFFGGHQQHVTFGSVKVPAWKKAPRVRATSALLDVGRDFDVTPSNHDHHFVIIPEELPAKAKPIIQPLECRADAVRLGSVKSSGASMPIDLSDPMARRLNDELVRLNAFFDTQDIGGASHRGFKRIFHASDTAGFAWDKGGRLYSVGGANYQQAKKVVRKAMTINGEGVVELDIAASHLTILYALRGLPLDLSTDPYDIPELPREVVKTWVTMTLGHDKLHVRWPPKAKESLETELVPELGKAFPLKTIRQRIVERHPVFEDWQDSTLRWPDFQFVESRAVVGAVATLAFDHGVPCLPVHDSIIVPASQAALAERVLKAAFRASVGVEPVLKVA